MPLNTLDIYPEISSKVESVISSDSIVVFSKTTCPFCSKVKGLFKDKDVDVKYIELDQVRELWRQNHHLGGGANTKIYILLISSRGKKILSLWLQVPDGAEMQDYLKEKTGQGTVPNVFINGKHLGKLS